MEIISGIAGGTQLESPRGMNVRPTAVRARKALFDSLGPLNGKVVADFFSGSGALGLEAASRGAGEVVFFDDSPSSLACVAENCLRVAKAGVETGFHVVKGRLPSSLERATAHPRPSLIFADPPYAESSRLFAEILGSKALLGWLDKGATLVWEMPDGGLELDSLPREWKMKTVRQFGSAKFLFLEPA